MRIGRRGVLLGAAGLGLSLIGIGCGDSSTNEPTLNTKDDGKVTNAGPPPTSQAEFYERQKKQLEESKPKSKRR